MFLILWNFIYFNCHILSHVSGFPDLELLPVINHRPIISASSSVFAVEEELWKNLCWHSLLFAAAWRILGIPCLILHGLRCTQNYTVKSEVKTMDFLLSPFNMGKIIKGEGKEKKKKQPHLGVEVCYFYFFIFMQHLLGDYVVVIYKINDILSVILTMSLNLWTGVLLLVQTLLLPCSSASPEDGAPLFCQDLKKIMPDSEIFRPHVLMPKSVVITRVFQTSADSHHSPVH